MFRVGGRPIFALDDRPEANVFHPPGNTIFTDRKSHLVEFIRDFQAAVTPLTFHENRLDIGILATVLDRPLAFGATTPSVKTASRLRENPAHLFNTPLSEVLV